MRTPTTNICPLLVISRIGSFERPPAVCLYDRCAWWDGNECAMVTAAIAAREVAENLEALATKSQTLGILQKEAPVSATNADEGGVDTSDQTVSASHDTKETEDLQA